MLEYFKNVRVKNQLKLIEYIDFCNNNKSIYIKNQTENHHILPQALFPDYSNLKDYVWNRAILLCEDHYIAHSLLAQALDEPSTTYAWWGMTHKNDMKGVIDSTTYGALKQQSMQQISLDKLGTTTIIDLETGDKKRVTVEEFKANPSYVGVAKGKVNVKLIRTGENITVNKDQYDSDIHLFHTKGRVVVVDKKGNNISVTKQEYYKNKQNYSHNSSNKVCVKDEKGNTIKVSSEEYKLGKLKSVKQNIVTAWDIKTDKLVEITKPTYETDNTYTTIDAKYFFLVDGIYMRKNDFANYLIAKQYKSTVDNFRLLKNKQKYVDSFSIINRTTYLKHIKDNI